MSAADRIVELADTALHHSESMRTSLTAYRAPLQRLSRGSTREQVASACSTSRTMLRVLSEELLAAAWQLARLEAEAENLSDPGVIATVAKTSTEDAA